MSGVGTWWYYFRKSGNSLVLCNHCDFSVDIGPTKSTNSLKNHLSKKHPDLFSKKQEASHKKAKDVEKLKRNQPQISFPTVRNELFDLPAKRAKIDSNENIIAALGTWEDDGKKTKQIDRLITEMICIDAVPFSTVSKSGFKRLISFIAPNYKIKSRKFYVENKLTDLYSSLYARIKTDLAFVEHLSFTTDAWSSNDCTHSLLSLTAHFLDDSFNPQFVVLGCAPIKGRHTADRISDLLLQVLGAFDIDKSKVHIFLRDAASSMKKATFLMNVHSFDCFAHKLQLSVKDGIQFLGDIDQLLEKVKKVVRKVKKSAIQREYLFSLQERLNLPQQVLIKNTEVRWNSTYTMLERFLTQKEAINLLILEDQSLPAVSLVEWTTIENIVEALKPIYMITNELQSRNATISCVIPLCRTLKHVLTKSKTLKNVKDGILSGLEYRMKDFKSDKNLIFATILDPRFKLRFFDNSLIEKYRTQLEGEATEFGTTIPVDESTETIVQTSVGSFFNDFLTETSQENAQPIVNVEKRTKVMVEVAEYLGEPLLDPSASPFTFWKEKSKYWPTLASLVRKYLSAPPGSVESERLFSTAGYIVNNLRKKLSSEHLEQLLFLHHNLEIYNFDY